MNKFVEGQDVIVSYERGGLSSSRIVTEEKGNITEVIVDGQYAGQYRVNIGWLEIVQPESAIRAA